MKKRMNVSIIGPLRRGSWSRKKRVLREISRNRRYSTLGNLISGHVDWNSAQLIFSAYLSPFEYY